MNFSHSNSGPGGGSVTRFIAGYALVLTAGVAAVVCFDSLTVPGGAKEASAAVRPADALPLAQAAVGFAGGSGVVTGVIAYDGDVPNPAVLVKKGDATAKDAAVCAAADVLSEELVVNKDNKGIANVFIYLPKAPAGVKAGKPENDEVVFDQKSCQFLPHGLIVQVGQKVLVKSGDPIPHNTRTAPLRNSAFNQTINANERKGVEIKYTKAEKQPIEVRCDYHPWMKAYHLVLDHPYMAVTDADGKFTIPNLPAGKHEFAIWHEKKGYIERKYVVEVSDGKTSEVKLSLKPAKLAGFDGPKSRSIALQVEP